MKAIIAVHAGSSLKIVKLQKHNLFLIEDTAGGGGIIKYTTCSHGDVGTLALILQTITTGEGGMIVFRIKTI